MATARRGLNYGPVTLRRTVVVVALVNLIWFFVQIGVALAIGSVSLTADAVDYLEDAAVNLLIAVALGWSAVVRARMGRVMAVIIVLPALAAMWQAIEKFRDPYEPDLLWLTLGAVGALIVNGLCAWLLVQHRHGSGSMTKAAWLAARNDVLVNLAILAMAALTLAIGTGWPDLILGVFVLLLNLGAAKEVWEAATEELDELLEEAGQS